MCQIVSQIISEHKVPLATGGDILARGRALFRCSNGSDSIALRTMSFRCRAHEIALSGHYAAAPASERWSASESHPAFASRYAQ